MLSVPQTDTGARGRVDQGVRVILRQGTRQISGRNFGIRPASFGWPQLKNPSNCLPKTQVSANTKVDV